MKKNIYVGGALLIAIAILGALVIYTKTPKTLEAKALYASNLGGSYLVRNQYEDGSFVYEYDAKKDEDLSGYNMVRHSGTTYALVELYQKTKEKKYKTAAKSALEYLLKTIAPCPAELANLSCAYDGEKTKLGGNALAILALVTYGEATGDTAYLGTAIDLALWIKATQLDNGEFKTHIQFKNGELDDHVSGYYPGEAVYALTRLYEATGDKQWLAIAEKGALWIITIRDAKETRNTIAHDHWLLYGLRELYKNNHNEAYLDHAKKIVDGIIAMQHVDGVDATWVGGYYSPPRSTPTATRSEGLGAAYELFLEAGENEYAEKAYEALEKGVVFQMRTFVDGPNARTFPNSRKALGGFRYSLTDDTVRIDYVQHNISSLLLYYNISQKKNNLSQF